VEEQEWLACEDPKQMLGFMLGRASTRKLRLFAAACCRRIWKHMAGTSRQVVELAEQHADTDDDLLRDRLRAAADQILDMLGLRESVFSAGLGSRVERSSCSFDETVVHATAGTWSHRFDHEGQAAEWAGWLATTAATRAAVRRTTCGEEAVTAATTTWATEERIQAALMRDIVGNPYHPVDFDPVWRTQTVVALATAAYEERILPSGELDSQRLAILADALEDAGCSDEQILNHLRGPGPHVRGCFVIDLLTGRE